MIFGIGMRHRKNVIVFMTNFIIQHFLTSFFLIRLCLVSANL